MNKTANWRDIIVTAWMVWAGSFTLVAMAAQAMRFEIAESVPRGLYAILLIGCVASAGLRLAGRLQVRKNGC